MTDRMVLKWEVAVDDRPHRIGSGQIVHVGIQFPNVIDKVTVWTIEPRVPTGGLRRRVQVFGTGQPLPYFAEHLGSAIAAGGRLVWHLFALPDPHEALDLPTSATEARKERV